MNSSADTDRSVCWDAEWNAFLVSGFAEATAVLRSEGWSSDIRLSPNAAPDLKELPIGNLLTSDPPDHTRLRRTVSPAFTPAQIAKLRPRVAAIVEATLDGLGEMGPQVDILADLGQAVSLAMICELFDVGTEGAQLFNEQTPNLMRGVELNATLDDLTASAAANAELMLFLTPILAERRQRPGDDFISALFGVDELELHEVMSTALLLLLAGHLTTANLIA
ncbi:MAG TPA: hypothetical protein VHV82_13255, partial [Sporichthyaceae bacterium]|nr:hypothetical protein [Sporichthyaceae bacterium]